MTIQEIEDLLEETLKLPRAFDKVALSQAVGTLEVARQLALLNLHLAGNSKNSGKTTAAAKKKKK